MLLIDCFVGNTLTWSRRSVISLTKLPLICKTSIEIFVSLLFLSCRYMGMFKRITFLRRRYPVKQRYKISREKLITHR